MKPVGAERVSKPSEVRLPDTWMGALVDAVGRGFAAYTEELGGNLSGRLGRVDSTLLPGASEIASLAVSEVEGGRTVTPEQAIPTYLRDDVAKPAVTLAKKV
jgi:tRNA threonylcarbamoyladenosine biosynthesis protein TsaB